MESEYIEDINMDEVSLFFDEQCVELQTPAKITANINVDPPSKLVDHKGAQLYEAAPICAAQNINSNNNMLKAATTYATIGLIPISVGNKKNPRATAWQHISAAEWKEKWLDDCENIGLRTGEEGGIVVIDVDKGNNGMTYWDTLKLTPEQKEDLKTVSVATGGGGLHYYFKWDENAAKLGNRVRAITVDGQKVGIDIKGNGGYVVAPPSIHPSGNEYKFVNDPASCPVRKVPSWLVDMFAKKKEQKEQKELKEHPIVARPVLGGPVKIGKHDATLTLDIVKLALTKIECPADVQIWGALMQNVKSILVKQDDQKSLYDVFDVWAKKGNGYDAIDNLHRWYQIGVPSEAASFNTIIGMAMNNGLAAAYEAINYKPPPSRICDHSHKFYFDDLVRLAQKECTLDEIKAAIRDTVAFVRNIRGMWIIKTRTGEGHVRFEMDANIKGVRACDVKITGREGPTRLAVLIDEMHSEIDYTGVEIIPYRPDEAAPITTFFNLFPGFHARPIHLAQLPMEIPKLAEMLPTMLEQHITQVWCNNNVELANYCLNWLAYLVQNPREKPGTALVGVSAPGAGKNIVTDFLCNSVFGYELGYTTTDVEKILGKHNTQAQGRRLVVLNEVGITGDSWSKTNDRLKGLITDTRVDIEPKGVNAFSVNDYAAYIIFSNHAAPLKIEDGDRRYVCLAMSSERIGDVEYFEKMLDAQKSPGSAEHTMTWLLTRDIKTWNPRRIPMTEMKRTIQKEQAPSSVRFLADLVAEHDFKVAFETPASKLYDEYKIWADQNGEKQATNNHFGRQISSHCKRIQKRDPLSGKRVWVYHFTKSPF